MTAIILDALLSVAAILGGVGVMWLVLAGFEVVVETIGDWKALRSEARAVGRISRTHKLGQTQETYTADEIAQRAAERRS